MDDIQNFARVAVSTGYNATDVTIVLNGGEVAAGCGSKPRLAITSRCAARATTVLPQAKGRMLASSPCSTAATTSAGTRVALASSTACQWVQVTAETDNTGIIVIGGSTVVAALATRRGTPLSAGDTIVLPVSDLANVYIDATVSTDGVTFIYG